MFHSTTTRLRLDTTRFADMLRQPLTVQDARRQGREPLQRAYVRWTAGIRTIEDGGTALLRRAAAHPRPFLHAAILALAAVTAAVAIGE